LYLQAGLPFEIDENLQPEDQINATDPCQRWFAPFMKYGTRRETDGQSVALTTFPFVSRTS
jgi:hypothetical protein